MLQVAPSAYRRHAARQRNPELRSARAKRDERLMPHIERVWQANMQVYGAEKVWKQMNREDIAVARCTVERLMRRLGLEGVRRGKTVRTTIPDTSAPCPLDRVNRQFNANRPNQLWVSDFTYVSTWQGWLYVAFVVDVFARRIVGWRVSITMTTDFGHKGPFAAVMQGVHSNYEIDLFQDLIKAAARATRTQDLEVREGHPLGGSCRARGVDQDRGVLGIDLELAPLIAAQEVDLAFRYWEGAVIGARHAGHGR